jgi:hypothetical protein
MVWVLHSKRVADLNVFVSNREPKTIVTQVFWLRETDVGDLDRGESDAFLHLAGVGSQNT